MIEDEEEPGSRLVVVQMYRSRSWLWDVVLNDSVLGGFTEAITSGRRASLLRKEPPRVVAADLWPRRAPRSGFNGDLGLMFSLSLSP